MELDRERAHKAWRRAERIKQLSDRLIGLGRWGIGIDGVLAWVPVAGTAYSLGAGALLLNEALQVDASRGTITRMLIYLGLNSVASGVPVLGWAADTLFTAHAFAARALQRDIERRYGRPPDLEVVPSDLEPVTGR